MPRFEGFLSGSLRLGACAALAAAAMSASAIELRGFRGFAWGSDVDSLGEAQQVSTEAGMRCYRRPNENLMYGDAPIREVRYCFHDDRLFMVVVDSQVDEAALAAEIESTYGPPSARAPAKAAWGDDGSPARLEIAGTPGAPASMRIWSNLFAPREKHAHAAR